MGDGSGLENRRAMSLEGSTPSPSALRAANTAGRLLLVATPGSDPGGRWFDSNPRNFTEVIRPDEEPVLKTGRGYSRVGSSPTTSARCQ